MIRMNYVIEKIYHLLVEKPFRLQHVRLLEREILGTCRSVLDVGCGNGAHTIGLKDRLDEIVGIDAFDAALEGARQRGVYTKIVSGNILELKKLFPTKSFDCVVAFDVIEHLTKDDGLKLLHEMESLARKKVIVFTPNGFLPQEAIDGNVYQRHLSGWDVREMERCGYDVKGVHGLRVFLGERSEPRWRPRRVWKALAVATQPLVLWVPKVAFQLFCVKNLKEITVRS